MNIPILGQKKNPEDVTPQDVYQSFLRAGMPPALAEVLTRLDVILGNNQKRLLALEKAAENAEGVVLEKPGEGEPAGEGGAAREDDTGNGAAGAVDPPAGERRDPGD